MTNPAYVLDASALLAVLQDEPGAQPIARILGQAAISAVNLSEVYAKLSERNVPADAIRAALNDLDLDVVGFDRVAAETAGLLRQATMSLGLSFGDRACLALARELGATAVTTDRAWGEVDAGVKVEVFR